MTVSHHFEGFRPFLNLSLKKQSFRGLLDVFLRYFGGHSKIFWVSFKVEKNYLELLQKTTSTAGLISLMIFIVLIFHSYQSTALIIRYQCVGGCPKILLRRFDNILYKLFPKYLPIFHKVIDKLLTKCLPTPCFVLHASWCFGDLRTQEK